MKSVEDQRIDLPELDHWRASSYTIYADMLGEGERVLLVHGYSGAYDVVSRNVANYLRSLEVGPVPKPLYGEWVPDDRNLAAATIPSASTLNRLKQRGYLTQKSLQEEESLFVAAADQIHAAEGRQMPSYVIMPTYSCNLRCGYCFQDHMRTDPAYSHLLRTMTKKMVDRIMSAIPDFEARRGVEQPTTQTRGFTLFGGEPLLKESLPVVEYLVESAKRLGPAEFGAITNATDLAIYQHLLGPGKISFLQITIDGPRAKHDVRRIYANGKGSFDQIAANVSMALEIGVIVSVRMNIDRSNISELPELAQYFVDAGWTKYRTFSSYCAPVTDSGVKKVGRRHELFNTWELAEAVSDLRQRFPAVNAISPVDDSLRARVLAVFTNRTSSVPSRASFCGAHSGMYVIDAFGDIYACWERTGDRNIRIGYIDDSNRIVLNALNSDWRRRTVTSNPVCRKCRFALYCGGGCAILAESSAGTMFSNHCDAFGKRFRAKVAEAFEQFADGEEIDPASLEVAARQEFVR